MSSDVPSLDEDENKAITFVSKDSVRFSFYPKKWAKISKLICVAIESDAKETEIPLNIHSTQLQEIIAYMLHHQGNPRPPPEKPLSSSIMKEVCADQWDAELMDAVNDRGRKDLYALFLAANYLDIKPLLQLCAAKIASLIRFKPLETIGDILKGKK